MNYSAVYTFIFFILTCISLVWIYPCNFKTIYCEVFQCPSSMNAEKIPGLERLLHWNFKHIYIREVLFAGLMKH